MGAKSFVERFQIAIFFGLTLFAWVIWVPQAAHRFGYAGWAPSVQSPLNALTVWAPGLAAMLLARVAGGRGAPGDLFRQLARWRVHVGWYAAALLFEPAKWALAFGLDRLVGRHYELGAAPLLQSFGGATAYMIPVALLFTLPNALGEELGWRAFALPRLERRHGPLLASVILGLFWGVWHLPMWTAWARGELSWHFFAFMIANMIPLTILFTWLYDRSGRSLLLVVLFHASTAAKGYLLPRLPTFSEAVILWLAALAVVAFGGFFAGGREATAEGVGTAPEGER